MLNLNWLLFVQRAIIRILPFIIINCLLILTGRIVFIKVDKLLFIMVCEGIVVCILFIVADMTLSLGGSRIALNLIMLRLDYNWLLLLLLLQRVHNCRNSLLRSVLPLADTTFGTSRMIRFACVAGGTNIALISPDSLTLITSETASQMLIGCTGCGSCIDTCAVYFLLNLDWRIAGSIVSTSNLVLFFYDSSLGLII